MELTQVKETDLDWISEVINRVFPYTDFTKKKLTKKISNTNYNLLILKKEGERIGFSEVEYLGGGSARLNAVFVREEHRRRGLAKKLLGEVIINCKLRGIKKIFLLVKKDNIGAKKFYEESGFVFIKLFEKRIDDAVIEYWEKII